MLLQSSSSLSIVVRIFIVIIVGHRCHRCHGCLDQQQAHHHHRHDGNPGAAQAGGDLLLQGRAGLRHHQGAEEPLPVLQAAEVPAIRDEPGGGAGGGGEGGTGPHGGVEGQAGAGAEGIQHRGGGDRRSGAGGAGLLGGRPSEPRASAISDGGH